MRSSRESAVGSDSVVLEIGAGEGALTERLAACAAHVHAVEIDSRLRERLTDVSRLANVSLHWEDAMRLELADLRPPPEAMVSNLPYSIATPMILRTIAELPGLGSWTLMVQREIADRLRAQPGSRLYGGPSVLAQIAAEVRLLRKVDPAVFKPRPRVESALIGLRRTAAAADPFTWRLVREGFAHRRKSLARSLELAQPGRLQAVREALGELGLPADARAETLAPAHFLALGSMLEAESHGLQTAD